MNKPFVVIENFHLFNKRSKYTYMYSGSKLTLFIWETRLHPHIRMFYSYFLKKNDVVVHIIDCAGKITTFSCNDISAWIYTRVL